MRTVDLEARLRRDAPGPAPYAVPDVAVPAAAAGLLDVGYALHDSPVGQLLLAATPAGLVRLAYLDGSPDAWLEQLAATLSPRLLRAPAVLDEPRFELRLDWRLTRGFGRRVLRATAAVPFGELTTYARVAGAAGSPRGYRAAGNALGANPLPIVVPCHRVLASGGGLGGYTGGVERKRTLLALEGVDAT
jgi:methylated-DNA-[protein]-cysteine S-methyltransferase